MNGWRLIVQYYLLWTYRIQFLLKKKKKKKKMLAFEFFNHINLFYGTITNFCTSQTCPTMSAGPG